MSKDNEFIDKLYQDITDICFNNGGATKPMVDKLAKYIDQKVLEARLESVTRITQGGKGGTEIFYQNIPLENYITQLNKQQEQANE